jgi:hypothetical protein
MRRYYLPTNGLDDRSFKLSRREANLLSKGKCQILRCLKIEEQLLSATILCFSELIDKAINDTRAQRHHFPEDRSGDEARAWFSDFAVLCKLNNED